MKLRNLYKVEIKQKEGKDRILHVVGSDILNAINNMTAKEWDSETSSYKEAEYLEEDVLKVELSVSNIICPDYL